MPKSKQRKKRPTAGRPSLAAPAYRVGRKAGDGPAVIQLPLPSGNVCLVRTVGVQGLIEAGILHQIDSLTDLVSEKYFTPPSEDGDDAKIDVINLAQDADAIAKLFDVVNRVVCYTLVAPEAVMPPDPTVCALCARKDSEHAQDEAHSFTALQRKDGVTYIDTVDEADRMFIFNAVTGGTQDLARFRDQLQEVVGGMDAVAIFEGASE